MAGRGGNKTCHDLYDRIRRGVDVTGAARLDLLKTTYNSLCDSEGLSIMRPLCVRGNRTLLFWTRPAAGLPTQGKAVRWRSTHPSHLETGHIEVGENEGLLFVNSKAYLYSTFLLFLFL